MLRNRHCAILALSILSVAADKTCERGNCAINVRMDLAGKKPPVILSQTPNGYELAQPTIRCSRGSFIDLRDKRILLTCPGKRNSLTLGGQREFEYEASCSSTNGDNFFEINGQEYQTDEVHCAKRVMPYEFVTDETCSGDGELLKLGYMVDSKFYDLIQVCHRVEDGRTYYSRHVLDGGHFSTTGNSSKRPDDEGRPKFSYHNKALYRGFPPNKYFKTKAQAKLLSLLNSQSTGNTLTFNQTRNKFFSRGHLSPNGDFILRTWRDVTFLYVNSAPQWQEINGRNWAEIEASIRDHAITTGRKYDVITGTHGTLTLNNNQLYLDFSHQRLPVPEHFIKLVREVESNKCIAFIVNNFPLEKAPDHKCEDICLQYGWPDLKDEEEGYVSCCPYAKIQEAYPKSFPRADCSGGILENKSRL